MFLSWHRNGETPPKPSIDGAIEFWASKDPAETYQWDKADICACGQYAKAIGDQSWMKRNDRRTLEIWNHLNAAACISPRTFGALVERVRSHQHFELV